MKCPNCGSTHTTKAGTVITKKNGKTPRLKCQNCATTFYQPQEKKQ